MMEKGDENVKNYEGDILNCSGVGKKGIAVNLVYVDMKQDVPNSYAKNPKIFFDPDVPEVESEMIATELTVNQRWDKLKMKRKMRECIKSTKLYGVCGLKTYYQFKKNFVKDQWDDSVFNDEVRTDMVPLSGLLKDPSSTSWAKSPWIGHDVEDLVDNIAKKFKIKGDDKKHITISRSAAGSDQVQKDQKSKFQYGRYTEIEDRINGIIFTVIEGIETKVFDKKKQDFGYDTMWDFLMYNDIPGRPNTHSDYHFWKDQLKEVARYRTMQVNNAKKGVAKYKWRGKPPSENQRSALRSAKDSMVIELKENQDVDVLNHAPINPGIFNAEASVRNDIQIISKQAPRQSVGEKTATEVKAVEMAAQEISSEKLDILGEVIESVATKWAILMSKRYDATKTVPLTGLTESEFLSYQDKLGDNLKGKQENAFLVITKKDLTGKVRARVRAGSTLPDTDQSRMAKLQGFAQFVAQSPEMISRIDPEEMLKEGVEIFDVRNDNLLKRKDNPVQESKILNTGVFLPAKMGEDHDKHLIVHLRETNNNEQNVLHISMHEEFKRQIDENAKAQQVSMMKKQQDVLSGQSFVGAEGLPQPQLGGNVNNTGNPGGQQTAPIPGGVLTPEVQ